MTVLDIGLTVSTLPVIALGVGIGVGVAGVVVRDGFDDQLWHRRRLESADAN